MNTPNNKEFIYDLKELEFINKEEWKMIEQYSLTEKSNFRYIYETSIMLIDQNAKIVFTPYFRSERLNLEQDFEDLLAVKDISVEKRGLQRIELSQE